MRQRIKHVLYCASAPAQSPLNNRNAPHQIPITRHSPVGTVADGFSSTDQPSTHIPIETTVSLQEQNLSDDPNIGKIMHTCMNMPVT